MDTTVSITNSRENELQFDLSVQGADVSDMSARFVIEMNEFNYSFPCKKSDSAAQWIVSIPAMPQLPPGIYDFHFEIITNGYYFDPYNGKVEVIAEPTVSQSTVSKKVPVPVVNSVSVKSDNSTETIPDTKKDTPVKESTELDDLADAFLMSKKNKVVVVETEKDRAVQAMLREVGTVVEGDTQQKPEHKKPTTRKRTTKKTKTKTTDNGLSNLDRVIDNIGIPTDEQAKKVHDIINSVKKDKE